MFLKRKLRKLNKEATEDYIKTLERTNEEWKSLAQEYSLKYWELKARGDKHERL